MNLTPIALLDPRQQKYIEAYFSVESVTFGNSYQSARAAGYFDETARNLSHNRPRWLSEKLGTINILEPEHLLFRLGAIINSPTELTQNKLRAIDMMMKHNKMYGNNINANVSISIESVL